MKAMALTSPQSETNEIRLHFASGTRAERVRWLLEEIGLPYDLSVVRLWLGAHKRKRYLAVHPLGKVPALEIDQTIVFESLGICLYLADRFPDADLAPSPSERILRADYCTWMAFSAGTLEPAILEQIRARKANARGIPVVSLGPSLTPFAEIAEYMDRHLSGRNFLLGDKITAADVLNGSMMAWAGELGLLEGRVAILSWVARLKARPAYMRAMAKR
ncbi:MAG TPA: glutathione S-transferase family protein [Hyphomicrobium sp.]|nr:glutathione S-transferase family protein [Hyphomicrobium sp.]